MACSVVLAIFVLAVFLGVSEADEVVNARCDNGTSLIYGDNSVIVDPIQHSPCRCPQPRAFRLSDFVDLVGVLEPSYVILHRCGQAGCCISDDEECVAASKRKIKLRYQIHGWRENDYRTKTLYTDTTCECRKRKT